MCLFIFSLTMLTLEILGYNPNLYASGILVTGIVSIYADFIIIFVLLRKK